MTNTTLSPPAWYKQFWPWFLITFPAIAVIAGIITIILAVKSDDGLVKDDYYKEGLAINKTLESHQKAYDLQLSAEANWDKLTRTISLKLSGNLTPLPSRLSMELTYATRSNHDQIVTLFLTPDNKSYTGRTGEIKAGNWMVILSPEDKNWRISSRVSLPQQTVWNLSSK